MPAQLYWIFTAINIFILPFSVFNLLTSSLPIFKNFHQYVVISGSMEPVIGVGSLIYSVKESKYHAGDIISYLKNGEYIVHRIEKSINLGGELYYSTKGDSNKYADTDLVHQSEITGKINMILPVFGQIILFYKSFYGLIFVEVFMIFYIFMKMNNFPRILFLKFIQQNAKKPLRY